MVNAIQSWNQDNTTDVIEAKVKRILDDHANTILYSLVGLTKAYSNKYELRDFSVLHKYKSKEVDAKVKEFVDKARLPRITKSMKAEIDDWYEREMIRHIREELSKQIPERAKFQVEAYMKGLNVTTELDELAEKYLHLQDLLHGR